MEDVLRITRKAPRHVYQIGIRTQRVTWLTFYIQSALDCDNGLVIAVIRPDAE